MLVLSRKQKQQIRIGEDVVVTILQIKGGSVRVGIEAPREVHVMRGELDDFREASKKQKDQVTELAPATIRATSQPIENKGEGGGGPENPKILELKFEGGNTDDTIVPTRLKVAMARRN